MKFLSVCSGIEAASVAFNPLDWKAIGFSEIEPFPCKLLAHHYPDISNHGDMTLLPEKILNGEIEAPELLVGGTPCQAFSVAGKRLSLEDLRGNLTLTFSEITNAIDAVRFTRGEQPSIVFWENVPGILNTKDNAFGCFLGALAGENIALEPPGGKWTNAGCVFGPKRTVAWRVLDAQYFGVAQRRRRVFVVASARDDISPPEILFEFEGVRRDSAPRRKERKEVARTAGECFTASSFAGYREGIVTLRSSGGDLGGGSESLLVNPCCFEPRSADGTPRLSSDPELCPTLNTMSGGQRQPCVMTPFKQELTSDGNFGGGSETIAVIPFNKQRIGQYSEEDIASTCAARDYKDATDLICCVHGTQDPCTSESTAFALDRNNGQENVVCQSFQQNESRKVRTGDVAYTLSTNSNASEKNTPMICYALQGNMIGRSDNAGPQGSGINEELCFTQTKADIHAVAYSFDSLSSNSMKSSNPNSGCNEVDLAKTLDTSCLNTACNQGGMVVAYAVHENQRSEVKLTESIGTIGCGGGKPGQGYPCVLASDGDGVVPSVLSYGIPGNWIGRKPENGGNATEPMHDIAPCQTKTDVHAVACFSAKDYGADVTDNLSPTLRAGNHNTSHANSGNWMAVHVPFMSIRRLTPTECERLQGFPDGYTDIKPNGKPTPDGPRYKALGNSWAVPVVRWIGMRIQNSLNHKELTHV